MTSTPSQAKRIDRVGASLAAILGVTPLLPSGLTHLGWAPRGYIDLVVAALIPLWLVARFTGGPRATRGRSMASWPWDLLAAAIVGAAIHGLMAESRVTSPVFVHQLQDALGDLFRPINQATHPFYPLRVALTFVEGWITFRLVLAICAFADDPRHRATVAFAGWLAGAALVALLALAQYVTEFNLHAYWVRANPALVRAHSTFDDPNALGAYLALAAGLVVGLIRLDDGRWRRWWAVLLGVYVAGLLTTMSRSALGAVIVAPMAVLAFGPAPATRLHRWVRSAARAGSVLLLAMILFSVVARQFASEARRSNPDGPLDMVIKTFDPRESTGWVLRGRLPWWQAGAAMFREHPIVGVGLGRYPRLMESYGGGPLRENTHNLFLQFLAETGVVGFAAFTTLCGAVCVALWRAFAAADTARSRGIALGGLIGVLAYLLTLLTGHSLLLPSGQILLASVIGLVVTIAVPSRSSNSTAAEVATLARRRWRFGALLLAVALIAPIVAAAERVSPRFAGRWGYHWGLYGEEPAGDTGTYRWTSRRALLDLRVPNDATTLVVPFDAVVPIRAGAPARVHVRAGRATQSASLETGGPQALRLPLPSSNGTARRILLDITVEPTFVPAALDARSTDLRSLGVQLSPPRFERE